MSLRYKVKDLVPTIRPLANTTTQTAQTALLGTYAALGQTSSTPTPVIEGDLNSFNHDYEEDGVRTYWYHPDHLGSSSYITNIEGIVTQHLEYMPYGESLVEEHQNSINTPYKFNGKEQDDETGNYYYGARYYNPKFSFWLSVDPLAEEFYDLSPYAYVSNNPLRYTDPTGMGQEDIIFINSKGTVTEVVKQEGPNVVYQSNKYLTDYKLVDIEGTTTEYASNIKIDDKIVDGELFRLVRGVEIYRKDIDIGGDDKYGHWWVEMENNSESYGWWPKNGVSYSDTLFGTEGELNGQSSFGGTATSDPHQGDRSTGVNKFNVYTTENVNPVGIPQGIRDFANNYSGQWSWPSGQNCHSFQEGFMKKLKLVINP